jgi:hypothetical protein
LICGNSVISLMGCHPLQPLQQPADRHLRRYTELLDIPNCSPRMAQRPRYVQRRWRSRYSGAGTGEVANANSRVKSVRFLATTPRTSDRAS